jgi:hypothetical protein
MKYRKLAEKCQIGVAGSPPKETGIFTKTFSTTA